MLARWPREPSGSPPRPSPDLDVRTWLARLDALGYRAAERLTSEMDVDHAATAVAQFLFEEEGFRGNAEDYYDPRNSFLHDVLDRRLGIPITLSDRVRGGRGPGRARGRRAWDCPGHFIVRAERRGRHRLIDPFHGGGLLDRAACEALVARVRRGGGPLDPRWLAPVTTRQIFVRMLSNLKAVYTALGTGRARCRPWSASCCSPPTRWRSSATAARSTRDSARAPAAVRDWEAYLQRAPEASDAGPRQGPPPGPPPGARAR